MLDSSFTERQVAWVRASSHTSCADSFAASRAHPNGMSSYTEKPGHTSLPNGKGHRNHVHSQETLLDLVEFSSAISSAWFMTSYMDQVYPVSHPPHAALPEPSRLDLIPRSSQWLHLGACIVFGCSATSFLHRRQLYDPLQPYIFAACISIGTLVGGWIGASADYIMLVHVSWAVCTAMLASSALSLRFCSNQDSPRTTTLVRRCMGHAM